MRFVTLLMISFLAAPSAFARLQLSKNFVSLYARPGGVSGVDTVYVRNTGREELRLSSYDSCFNEFHVFNGCRTTLRPGGSCYIQVQFMPRNRGYSSCSINLRSNMGDYQNISVSGQSN